MGLLRKLFEPGNNDAGTTFGHAIAAFGLFLLTSDAGGAFLAQIVHPQYADLVAAALTYFGAAKAGSAPE